MRSNVDLRSVPHSANEFSSRSVRGNHINGPSLALRASWATPRPGWLASAACTRTRFPSTSRRASSARTTAVRTCIMRSESSVVSTRSASHDLRRNSPAVLLHGMTLDVHAPSGCGLFNLSPIQPDGLNDGSPNTICARAPPTPRRTDGASTGKYHGTRHSLHASAAAGACGNARAAVGRSVIACDINRLYYGIMESSRTTSVILAGVCVVFGVLIGLLVK